MLEITSKIVKTDVTCVKCFQKFILAGIGNNLHVYSIKGDLLQIYPTFDGQKIHGIIPNATNKIAVFGENHIKVLEFDFISCKISKHLLERFCDDWIFDLQWLESDTQIATIFAKNFLTLWSSTELKHIKSIGCEERCILYSATFINNTWDNLFVCSGTVFGQILIWKPSDSTINFSPVLHRLIGHDGAIFSIAYSEQLNTIVTTSDDRTVRLWTLNDKLTNNCQISLNHTMYGHIARVFRCKIIKKFVITAGEDSFVHIWNFNGKLIRKFETHQGACVWSLDYCTQEDVIITGGGDSGISLYPLTLNKNIEIVPIIQNLTPKSLKLTYAGNIVIIMDTGSLIYYKTKEKVLENVNVHEDLKNYAVLEVSENRKLIALAGFQGSIHIYKEKQNSLKKLYSYINSNSERIFSLHWLNNNQFLTSTVNGIMNIWTLKDVVEDKYELISEEYYILPVCKERWATCATFCFKNNIVVGDRKGNLHLYELSNAECVQSIKKAHCHLGVTSLYYFNNLYSLGRNGILNKYSMNSTNQLFQITNDKLPFSWLSSMIKQDNTHLIIGFSGSNFIIYNLDQRRIILELNCGGGHRSWDLIIKNSMLYFYFIKEKRLNFFSEKWLHILSRDLVNGYHTKEINSGVFIKPDENNLLFLSGGEDTTLRLSRFDFQTDCTKYSSLYVLKSHLSSIRCIKIHVLNNNNYLIFSGGGRAQIIVQKLSFVYVNNKFKSIECHQMDSYYKQLNEDEAETRIMDFTVIDVNKSLLLIAGSSDGSLKCFNVCLKNYKLKLIHEILHAQKCIIHLSHSKICDRHIVISMATDGNLIFWDFTDFYNKLPLGFKPFYLLKTNQLGISSFSSKKLNNDTYLFATGGDDNAIVLNVIDFAVVDDSIIPTLISKWDNSKTHGAQITGIYFYNNYFISTSIDQHISIFKFKFENRQLKCEFLKQYCSPVSDIQGMDCILFKNDIYGCVYGKGLEICHISLLNS